MIARFYRSSLVQLGFFGGKKKCIGHRKSSRTVQNLTCTITVYAFSFPGGLLFGNCFLNAEYDDGYFDLRRSTSIQIRVKRHQ